MNRPRPDFFIIGQSKSGTSAMYHFLRAHPQIFMCSPKEPNYFARDFLRDPDPGGSFHPHTEAWYLGLFEGAEPGQRCGEASACYIYSREAIPAIRAFNPEAQLIVMLREPVDFLYSYYLQQRKNPITEGEDAPDFATALALEPERKAGRHIPPGCLVPELLYYSERIRYAEQLERVYASFPRDQVLVLIYDDFRADNAAVYRQVLAFLGVDTAFQPVFQTHNKGAELRSRRLQRWMRAVTFGEGWAAPAKRLLTGLIPGPVRKRAVRAVRDRLVFRPKAGPDPALVDRLKRAYRPEVKKVSELLGRDLVRRWGYDRLEEAT